MMDKNASRQLGCFDLIWRVILAFLGVVGFLALVVMVAAVLGVGAIRSTLGGLFAPPEPVTLNSATVLTLVQRQAVLRTARYNFEKVVPVAFSQAVGGVAGEKLLYIGVGYVNAGVDLTGLDESAVMVEEDGHVSLALPPAHLTDCVLNPQESYIYQHDVGALNFLYDAFNDEPDLLEVAEREAIVAFRESALESGILEQARKDAEQQLRALLIAAGFETVSFTTPPGAAPAHDPACLPPD